MEHLCSENTIHYFLKKCNTQFKKLRRLYYTEKTLYNYIENDETNGPFIQTFKFVPAGILFALIHDSKTSDAMKKGVDLLESTLGTDNLSNGNCCMSMIQ